MFFREIKEIEKPEKREVKTPSEIKRYFDDNGELFKVGDELLPYNEFVYKGLKYTTDELGRIKSVEGYFNKVPGSLNEAMGSIHFDELQPLR